MEFESLSTSVIYLSLNSRLSVLASLLASLDMTGIEMVDTSSRFVNRKTINAKNITSSEKKKSRVFARYGVNIELKILM